jgi:hypothetical protein
MELGWIDGYGQCIRWIVPANAGAIFLRLDAGKRGGEVPFLFIRIVSRETAEF